MMVSFLCARERREGQRGEGEKRRNRERARTMDIHSFAVTKLPAWSFGRSLLAASSILSTLASERPLTSMRVFLGTVSKDLTVAKPASFTFCAGGKKARVG